MQPTLMSENEIDLSQRHVVRSVLERFERAKILEVYFSRLDGRVPQDVPEEYSDLYEIDLGDIKSFLLGQHPQDTLLQKVFRLMHE